MLLFTRRRMHRIHLLALFSIAAAAPAAGQGIVVPVACDGECPARLPDALTLDSIDVFADVAHGRSITYVHHAFSHAAAGSMDGEFFFPLPDGAVVTEVVVYEPGRLETAGEWTAPAASREILERLLRERPSAGLRMYDGRPLVHVRVPSISAEGTQRVRLVYTQPLHRNGAAIRYRYPLSGGAAAPGAHVEFRATIKTDAGFASLHSPSHAVEVSRGTELGPCPPGSRCGSTSVASDRVKEVRLRGGSELRTRDIEIVFTPANAAVPRSAAAVP